MGSYKKWAIKKKAFKKKKCAVTRDKKGGEKVQIRLQLDYGCSQKIISSGQNQIGKALI